MVKLFNNIIYMNLVSVIIPYYRKKKYFKRTLNSILSQSYKKIEIIIIYDDTDLQELTFLKKITNYLVLWARVPKKGY